MAKNALCGMLSVLAFGACAVACGGAGSSGDGTFGPAADSQTNGTSGGSNDPGSSAGGGSIGGSGGASSSSGGGNTGGSTASCATSTLSALAQPLHLVLLLDRSGSMCEYDGDNGPSDCSNKTSKWLQAMNAVKTFVASPDTRGLKASVIMFPYADNNDLCTTSKYTTPIAPEVTLPDSTVIAPAIDKKTPTDGETPTMNALTGTITYAQSIITATGGKEKVAIVIATDGYPQGCSDDSDIQPACKVAKAVAGTIPTYVIGVGDLSSQLDLLAAAGGTTKSFTASVSTPSQTGAQLATALATIRGATMSCNFNIPAAPAGQTFDYTKVNVQVTSKGTPSTIGYSQDCSDPTGWKYDNATAPTQVELCSSACDTVKADAYSSVNLVLGCATKQAGVN